MTNIFQRIFNDDAIVGLCSIMDDNEKRAKWIKKKLLKKENLNSSIIFQRNLNRFILNQANNFIDQTLCCSSSSSQNQTV